MPKWLRWVGRIAGWFLGVVGWAGVPDDLASWSSLLSRLDQGDWRTAMVASGLVLLFIFHWPERWYWWRASELSDGQRADLVDLRTTVGQIAERLGDYGPPLCGEEDDRMRARWQDVRLAAGTFSHHPKLRQALRDFDNRLGWMMRHKSEGTAGGIDNFRTVTEEDQARSGLNQAHRRVMDAIQDLL